MVIKELYICAYGSLRDRSFKLSEKLNIITGENEAGKSTLMSFISFMLYGPDETAMRYIRATVGECGGRMTVSSVKGDFLVERRVASSEPSKKVLERFSLYSLPSMKEIGIKGQPGDFILGVSRNFFMGTSFVSQKGASVYDPEKTSDAVQNILLSANEKIDTGRALRKVDEIRKYFMHKRGRGGVIADAEDRLSALSNERFLYEQSRTELERTDSKLSELKKKREEALRVLEALKKEKEARRAKAKRDMLQERDALVSDFDENSELLESARAYIDNNDILTSRSRLRELDVKEKYYVACLADAENDVRQAENALNAAKIPDDSAYSTESEQKLIRTYEISSERRKALGSRATLCFVLSVLCAAFAVICGVMTYVAFAVAFAAVVASLAVCGLVLLDKKKKDEIALGKALSAFGLDGSATLRDISETFARIRVQKDNYLSIEKRMEEKTDRLTRLKQEARDCRVSLEEVLSQNPNDTPSLPIDRRIEAAESFFTDVISKPAYLSDKCHNLKERILLLDRQISSVTVNGESTDEPSPKFAEFNDELIFANIERLDKEKDILAEEISVAESDRERISSGIKPADELDRLIAETKDEIVRRKEQYETVLLADEAIRYASENLRSSVTPNLIEIGDRLFSQITQEKYSRIGVDESLAPNGIGNESIRSTDTLSYGTNEAMYIAFRLSLLLVLCRSELPVMLLDESFAHIDDNRTKSTLRVLAESGAQSLVFTCSEREGALAESADIIRL